MLGRRLEDRYRWRLNARDRSPIFELDPHRKIVAIDVERDVDILRVQIGSGRITEAPNFTTGQNQPTNGVWIAGSAVEPIPQMDGAEFVFVGSFLSVLAHRYQRDLIG